MSSSEACTKAMSTCLTSAWYSRSSSSRSSVNCRAASCSAGAPLADEEEEEEEEGEEPGELRWVPARRIPLAMAVPSVLPLVFQPA